MKPQLVKLSEVCQIESGGTPDSSNPTYWNGDINWATLVDVKGKYVGTTKRKISSQGLKNSSAKLLPIGTVLFSSRATIGEVSIATAEIATNQGFKNFICDQSKVIPDYLYYVLKHEAKKISDSVSSTTFKEISKSKLSEYKIPLPSLEDQKRIVRTLDEANTLRQKRKQAIGLLDEYLQSVFIDMFGDPVENSKKWKTHPLRDLCFAIADIDHNMPKESQTGYPFISAKDLVDNGISFENVKHISKNDFLRLSRKIKPQKGDIIYSRIGARLGKSRIVKVDFDFLVSYSCCTIKPDNKLIMTDYLNHLLNTPPLLRQALKDVRAIGVPDLGMDKIRDFVIITPPMNLQKEFSIILEKTDLIKQNMTNQLNEFENQFQSLIQHTFSQEQ